MLGVQQHLIPTGGRVILPMLAARPKTLLLPTSRYYPLSSTYILKQ